VGGLTERVKQMIVDYMEGKLKSKEASA
jgi:hypothetical protein